MKGGDGVVEGRLGRKGEKEDEGGGERVFEGEDGENDEEEVEEQDIYKRV